MSRCIQMVVALAFVVFAFIVTAPVAQATLVSPVVYPLTSDHCTGGCGTPPFGTVTLEQNGTTVDVTVSLNNPPNFFVKSGAGDRQWFLFNAIGVVVTDITVTQNFGLHPLIGTTGIFGLGAVGSFGFGITCGDCGNGGNSSNRFPGPLIFAIANATIDDLTAPSVVALNGNGNVFVADILSCSATDCGEEFNGTGNTGLVDATAPIPATSVPEPGTLALVASGLLPVGIALRRRWAARG